MLQFKAKIKKYGNELGFVIPKRIVEKDQIKSGQKLLLQINSKGLIFIILKK